MTTALSEILTFAANLARAFGAAVHVLAVARPTELGDDVETSAVIEPAPGSPTLWQVFVGIALGSITGALLRQATTVLLPNAANAISLRFAISALGGALLGAVLAWVTTMTSADSVWQQIAMITLVATLGTFAAAAVVGAPLISSKSTKRVRDAAMHIGTTLLSAALGIALALWWRAR